VTVRAMIGSAPGGHSRQADSILDDKEQFAIGHLLRLSESHVRRGRIHALAHLGVAAAVVGMTAGAVVRPMSARFGQEIGRIWHWIGAILCECGRCHGADAAGPSISTGPYAAYPSLRGQYAPYLIARLTNFHKHLPHDTTSDFIMGGVAQTLDDEAIQAIAAWLSSLTPERSL